LGHPIGALAARQSRYMKVLKQNHVAEFHRENAVLLLKQRVSISEPPFVHGGSRLTYAIHH